MQPRPPSSVSCRRADAFHPSGNAGGPASSRAVRKGPSACLPRRRGVGHATLSRASKALGSDGCLARVRTLREEYEVDGLTMERGRCRYTRCSRIASWRHPVLVLPVHCREDESDMQRVRVNTVGGRLPLSARRVGSPFPRRPRRLQAKGTDGWSSSAHNVVQAVGGLGACTRGIAPCDV